MLAFLYIPAQLMRHNKLSSRLIIVAMLFLVGATSSRAQAEQKWLRISSAHFSILTDAGEGKAKEALLRFEQMRNLLGQFLMKNTVNVSVPVDFILLKDTEEYDAAAPAMTGKTGGDGGYFIPGEDRVYILLDASNPDNWRAVSLDFAKLLLNFNYPPAQPWFDSGFPAYLSSLRIDSKHDGQAYIGGDPPTHGGEPFSKILSTHQWMTIRALFSTHPSSGNAVGAKMNAGTANGLDSQQMFEAESWMVMHYLINQDKLPEMGTYFGLVEARHMDIPDAVQQAFGISPKQFEQAVESYFQSLNTHGNLDGNSNGGSQGNSPASPAGSAKNQNSGAAALEHPLRLPVGVLDVGTSQQDVPSTTAQALIDEMQMRLPERRAHAIADLESLINNPAGPNSIEYRAFAWLNLQQAKFEDALQNLGYAARYDQNDPWVHFYSAVAKHRQARATHSTTQGLANMLIDLRIVIDAHPDFARAHDLLAQARMEGGGLHSAEGAAQVAIQLAPRRHDYVLHLAQIYLEDKKWDLAEKLFNQLKDDPDAEIAEASEHALKELPTLRKFGVPPASEYGETNSGQQVVISGGDDEDADSAPKKTPVAAIKIPKPDTRRVQFMEGKLLSVSCTKDAAVLTVSAGGRTFRLRTDDYKDIAVVGGDQFSCSWRDIPVAVNYRASGKSGGDLVSVELR